jgi:hypothetical protein
MPLNPDHFPIAIGGLNVNNVNGNGSVNVGDTVFQSAHSNLKQNVNGQVYGQGNLFSIQPLNSPILDPDVVDTPQSIASAPMGLED